MYKHSWRRSWLTSVEMQLLCLGVGPTRNDVLSIFKTAAVAAQYYFWFRIGWRHSLEKAIAYQQTKFHQDSSIHGWDVTTSSWEKLTYVILECYIQFPFWPYLHNRNIILHHLAKFHQNKSMSYQFFSQIEWTQVCKPKHECLQFCEFKGPWQQSCTTAADKNATAITADYKMAKHCHQPLSCAPTVERRRTGCCHLVQWYVCMLHHLTNSMAYLRSTHLLWKFHDDSCNCCMQQIVTQT